jgi:hypothetical protein
MGASESDTIVFKLLQQEYPVAAHLRLTHVMLEIDPAYCGLIHGAVQHVRLSPGTSQP